MKWRVISYVGAKDAYVADEDCEPRPLKIGFERPGDPIRMRHQVLDRLNKNYGAQPDATVVDLLYFGMAVYAADMLIPRTCAPDRWTRAFEVHHPVAALGRWRKCSKTLEEALGFLTGDTWTLRFRQREVEKRDEPGVQFTDAGINRVVLCSGGVDSLAGVIGYAEAGDRLCLVGHHGGGLTAKFQHAVMKRLTSRYQDKVTSESFHVLPPLVTGIGESTMRSRSLLFIALGIAVADVVGYQIPLSIPENGLITLNVPLTCPRNGSASTRTTHPHFISTIDEVLMKLNILHRLELPYQFQTKGEMLQSVDGETMRGLLSSTMSCSHPEVSRWAKKAPGLHCGYCVPCLIRRAAIHKAGMVGSDAEYAYDIVDGRFPVDGERGRDLRALRMALERLKSEPASRDVFTVLDSGPLSPVDIRKYANVYRRGMGELATMLGVGI